MATSYFTSLRSYSGLNSSPMKETIILLVIALCGCGGNMATMQASPNPPTSTQQITVFTGDSITRFWNQNGNTLPIQGAIDTGIPGADTATILSNFQSGTLSQKPDSIFILAGTNDLLFEANSTQTAVANIETMINEATTAGVHHIFVGTVPPVESDICPFNLCFGHDPNPAIAIFNSALLQMLANHPAIFVIDYHKAMSDSSGADIPGLFDDGVHPTALGYSIMDTAVHDAVKSSLNQ